MPVRRAPRLGSDPSERSRPRSRRVPFPRPSHHPDPPSTKPARTKRQAFCEGLWDGVVLCRLLNALAPSTPVDAMRADDPSLLDEPEPDRVLRKHNHVAFVRGAKDLGLDDDDMFSLDDLETAGRSLEGPDASLRPRRTDASLNDAARKENSSAGNPFGPGKPSRPSGVTSSGARRPAPALDRPSRPSATSRGSGAAATSRRRETAATGRKPPVPTAPPSSRRRRRRRPTRRRCFSAMNLLHGRQGGWDRGGRGGFPGSRGAQTRPMVPRRARQAREGTPSRPLPSPLAPRTAARTRAGP